MRCFYVRVHGLLKWQTQPSPAGDAPQTDRFGGFYTHRYVLASDETKARETAFRRIRENLDRETRWMSNGQATLDLEVDELSSAPVYRLIERIPGHIFYPEDQ